MAKTYTPGSGSDKDRVRLRLGDTFDGSMSLHDEEILDLLATYPFTEACAQAAEAIAGYYASRAEKWSEGDQAEDFGDRAKKYLALAKEIRLTQQPPEPPRRTGSAVGLTVRPDLKNYRSD